MSSRGTWTSWRGGLVWTSWGSTRPSASPAPVSGRPLVSIQAGGWRDWEQPCRAGLGGTGGWKAGHEPPRCAGSPEGQPYTGLHQKQRGQQVKGGDSASLLRSGETPSGVLHPALGVLQRLRQYPCWLLLQHLHSRNSVNRPQVITTTSNPVHHQVTLKFTIELLFLQRMNTEENS